MVEQENINKYLIQIQIQKMLANKIQCGTQNIS